MTVIRERDGQALVRCDEKAALWRKNDIRYEWWINTEKMKKGIKLEEINGKTRIYCFEFRGGYRERWLMEEFDRRVPKYKAI